MKITNWFQKDLNRVKHTEVDFRINSQDGYITVDKSDWIFGSQVFLKLKRKHDHMFQIVLTMSPKEALEIGEHLVIHAKTRIRHEGPVTN
jgi:hypothetical protein